MPTYRVPVRVTVSGYIDVNADDPSLAADAAADLGSYDDFNISHAEWIDWDSYGEPEEVE